MNLFPVGCAQDSGKIQFLALTVPMLETSEIFHNSSVCYHTFVGLSTRSTISVVWYITGIMVHYRYFKLTRSSADADKPALRNVTYIIRSVALRYIICNYRKANFTPSTAAQGSVRDIASPCKAALFNCSVFNIPLLPSEPHPDYSLKYSPVLVQCGFCCRIRK